MLPGELVLAVIALGCTVAFGTVVHELTHATVLRAYGIEYELELFPTATGGTQFYGGICGAFATVTPQSIPETTPVWGLRFAALAPLILTTPLLLVGAGVLPDPLSGTNGVLIAVTIGWFGCALPSPQDFSLFWHAETVIEQSQEVY